MPKRPRGESWLATYLNPRTLGFWSIHAIAIAGVIWLGWSWSGFVLALALYFIRMFFITAGYHRYFSHRSFKTSRVFQGILAFGAQTSMQRGVLWWAATHRHHHRMSDQEGDVHSPVINGFWWSHVGWSTSSLSNEANYAKIADLTKFRELRLLDRFKHWPGVALAVALLLIGGAHAVVWGFFVSTVVLWHGTFTINSLSHLIGRRRYETSDDSRNNWVLALITMGEGWHNNHHHYMSSANQGFRWYEIDLSYYLLLGLKLAGLVWDVRRAPAHVVHGGVAPSRIAVGAQPG